MARIKFDTKSYTMKQAMDDFLLDRKRRGLTAETISAYDYKLRLFTDYVGEDFNPSDITKKTVDGYVDHLQATHSNGRTVNSLIRSARAFIYFLQERGEIPSFKVRTVKAEVPVKETYSDSELARLLTQPAKKEGFSAYKTYCLECFLYGTGCRLSTALAVKWEDVDFQACTVVFTKMKSRKQQINPLSRELVRILEDYGRIRGMNPDDYIFCDSTGGHGDRRTFQELIVRYNRSRGVQNTSAHSFRHTYGKNMARAGVNAFVIQSLMGHSTIVTTQEYIKLYGQDLESAYDIYDPLGQVRSQTTTKHRITM